jgi:hypothetical protein
VAEAVAEVAGVGFHTVDGADHGQAFRDSATVAPMVRAALGLG